MALTPANAFGNAAASYLSGSAFAGNAGKVNYLLGLPGAAPPGFPPTSPLARYSKQGASMTAVALRIGPRCIMSPFVNWIAP